MHGPTLLFATHTCSKRKTLDELVHVHKLELTLNQSHIDQSQPGKIVNQSRVRQNRAVAGSKSKETSLK